MVWNIVISLHISKCERLSVMHRLARLPEIFDLIAQNTPVLEFGSEHPPPPPELKFRQILTL